MGVATTMKAVQISKNGGVEVLEHKDLPVPTLAAGQILVKNQFAGVNYIDTHIRSGRYASQSFPHILGKEAAGEVVQVHPSVTDIPVGARVVCRPEEGCYAEYMGVDASRAVVVPDGISNDVAAAIYLQGLTAWTFIREAANVQAGQWTLVHAAAGGTGALLVQMLRAVGANVIATASTEEKLAVARRAGAQHVINSNDDVVAKVKEITGGHGIDAIFDGVGKATFDADLEMIARKGHLIVFGNSSGFVDPINLMKLAPKNIKLMRPAVNGYITEREELDKYSKEIFNLVLANKVTVNITEIYPLKEVGRAHSDIEARRTTGKLLLNFD